MSNNSTLKYYKEVYDRLAGRNATLKDWFDSGYETGLAAALSIREDTSDAEVVLLTCIMRPDQSHDDTRDPIYLLQKKQLFGDWCTESVWFTRTEADAYA